MDNGEEKDDLVENKEEMGDYRDGQWRGEGMIK